VAIGQAVDAELVKHIGVEMARGCLKADPVTLETSVKGVFAGGDNASGPASAIKAVAAGKRASESIKRCLDGKNMLSERFEATVHPVPEELFPETKNIAKQLLKDHYRKTKVPLLFALVGELGTGKTTFCQGIGGYFSIDRVNSPTFNISKEYVFAFGVFYHIDTYRLESGEELLDLGFEKMLKKGNIIAIEWAQKAQKLLSGASAKVIWVFLKGENGKRKILVYL